MPSKIEMESNSLQDLGRMDDDSEDNSYRLKFDIDMEKGMRDVDSFLNY